MATKTIGGAAGAVIPASGVIKLDDVNPRRASIIVTNRGVTDAEIIYTPDALYGLPVRAGLSVLLESEGVVSSDSQLYLRGAAGLVFTAVIGYYGHGSA